MASPSGTGHDTARPEKIGDRVICPDGAKGYVALTSGAIPGAVFVQLDEMRCYMPDELEVDPDA